MSLKMDESDHNDNEKADPLPPLLLNFMHVLLELLMNG